MSNVKGGKSTTMSYGNTEGGSVNEEKKETPSTNIDGSIRDKTNPKSYPSGLGTGP
mgnify:CR=1 FL=1